MPSSKLDLGAGISNTVKEPFPPGTEVQHGEASQFSRILALGSYFVSGCMAINASQFLGAPLYLVNEAWYNAWIAFTKQSFGLLTTTMTQCWAPTVIRASGDKSVRGQLLKTPDGNLLCNFPQRLVLIANHQIYTDWMYLWYIAYTAGMHGRLFIILKESLKRIPVIGWGMQLSQFIFLKRNWEKDKPNMAEHLQKLNQAADPMWLLIFPEGTNLAPCTREKSAAYAEKRGIRDMYHQLLPRTTGLEFCLQQLRQTVGYVYDCTIAYEGVPRGEYAQDIFTLKAAYLEGRPPKSVNMYWRRFAVSSIPINNPAAFEVWLLNRWYEKDNLLEYFHRNGRFPADTGAERVKSTGEIRRGAGYIESEIKSFRWYEFMQIFAPMGLLALVLYSFYGSLPGNVMKTIVDNVGAAEEAQGLVQQQEKKLVTAPPQTVKKKVATTPKPPLKKPPARKTPIRQGPSKTTNAPKSIAGAPSTKQSATTPAKNPQPKSKPAATSAPQRPNVKPAVSAAPKNPSGKLAVKPTVKPAVKPAVPKKPDAPKPATKKPSDTQSQTSAAPKKLVPKPKPTAAVQKPAAKPGAKPAALKKVEKKS